MAGLNQMELARAAARFPMPRTSRSLSPYDHFAAMVFAQLTYRESLRDIEACLGSRRQLLYRSGIRGEVKRCNLAYANEHRDWQLFADVAAVLMRRARRLYQDQPAELGLEGDLFALDATLIELSLALFPWARWQRNHAAMKLNVLLDLRGDIPAFVSLHEGDRHEIHALDEIPVYAGSYYVMDRGFTDFERLARLDEAELTIEDVDVIELHDCFSANELITYERIVKSLGYLTFDDSILEQSGPALNSGRAMLLYGPPGNGKTKVARATCNWLASMSKSGRASFINGRARMLATTTSAGSQLGMALTSTV